jgi:hypothetical protein
VIIVLFFQFREEYTDDAQQEDVLFEFLEHMQINYFTRLQARNDKLRAMEPVGFVKLSKGKKPIDSDEEWQVV